MGGVERPADETPRDERSALERLFEGDADPSGPPFGDPPAPVPTGGTTDE